MYRYMLLTSVAVCLGCAQESADTPQKAQAAPNTAAAAKSEPAQKAQKAKPQTQSPKRRKVPGATLWKGIDLAAESAHLQGKWNVKMSFGKPTVWVVKGNAVEMTMSDGKIEKGTLDFQFPGRLVVKQSGMTRNVSYTRNGKDLYLGLGKAGMKRDDLYVVNAGRGIVRFDGKRCEHWEKGLSFGKKPSQFSGPDPVTCRVEGSTFHYQVPKRSDATKFDDKRISIVGDALVNSQMKGNLVTPAK